MTDEIDELREQTRGTDRISAESGEREDQDTDEKKVSAKEGEDSEEEVKEDEPTGPTPSGEFSEALAERARRSESGIDPRSISADDARLSAFLLALQDTGEIEDVGDAVRGKLGATEPPEYDRDAVVRLALTYALRDAAPEYFEELADGV
jgi:hypothetical protein